MELTRDRDRAICNAPLLVFLALEERIHFVLSASIGLGHVHA